MGKARHRRPVRAAGIGMAAAMAWVALSTPVLAATTPPYPPGRIIAIPARIITIPARIVSVAPAVQTQGGATQVTVTSDVLFAFDSATLSPDAQSELADLVNRLKGVPAGAVMVTGYTDSIGTPAYNLQLSTDRATAVRDYLTSQVATPGLSYQVIGKGQADPVAANTNPNGSDNPAGRQQNRRVVVTLPS